MADGATAATPYGPAGRSTGPEELGRRPARHLVPATAHPATEHPDGAHPVTAHPHGADHDGADHDGAGRAGAPETGGRVSPIDGRRFRSIMGHFATGVVAIAAIDPETGRPIGLAANSFTSVSLDPPLISFCVAHTSTTWPRIRVAGRHCVSILSAPQREVCLRFAAKGGDRFAGVGWAASPGGGPVIDGALAWLECSVEAEYPAGDHVIVVARVHHLDRHHDGEPLVFYKGAYGRFDG